MVFGCFGKKSVDVVPMGPEATRFPEDGKAKGRDGLHSAPNKPERGVAATRSGLHSAPTERAGGAAAKRSEAQAPGEDGAGVFVVEAGGASADAVDAYLQDVIGSIPTKGLRSTEWAERVNALECIQRQVITAQQASDAAQRLALFKATATVLSRMLSDKVVPVYLPALQLLREIYHPSFLAPLKSFEVPRAAVPLFAGQLVHRIGSSNVRAREESTSSFLHVARCEHAGPEAMCSYALRPLKNNKAAIAAVGQLELLRTLINEYGIGPSSGLTLEAVIGFALTFAEEYSDKSREAAMNVLLSAHGAKPAATMQLLNEKRPSVAANLNKQLSGDSDSDSIAPSAPLAISGRRLPPLQPLSGANAPAGDEETLVHHRTPKASEGRARARAAASELGASEPPRMKRSPSKKPKKAAAGPVPASPGAGLFDDVEEQLMESILDAN